ncbi:MAG TPA: sugar transferase, partial [Baekduia sp.]|nr:sugar transferase [Baekduia sp.]
MPTNVDPADLSRANLALDVLPDRDMRAKRPPMLSFLLRWSTLRRGARVVSLLALDLGAIILAIFTALCLKAIARDHLEPRVSWEQAKDYVPFAFLVASLLFARSGLYAERAQRPGLTRIVASLFQTTLVALIFAVVNGENFSSYYIFYGTLFFGVAYVSSARFAYEQLTGALLSAAGYKRRAVLVGTGAQIEAVAHALAASAAHTPVQVIGFVSLTPRPDNGLRSLGTLEEIGAIVTEHKADEVIIADPAFPQQKAVELVDTCHQRGVVVRIAPSTMEILIHRAEFVPGQSVPLFELKPPVFEGIDFIVKRGFDIVGSAVLMVLLSPLMALAALAIRLNSPGPILFRSMRPGIGGRPF